MKMELRKGEKLTLLNPEKYRGYASHPTEDKTIRQVLSASIERDTYLNNWYFIEIVFEGEHIFESASCTIKGCKQMFAFQCSAGSNWEFPNRLRLNGNKIDRLVKSANKYEKLLDSALGAIAAEIKPFIAPVDPDNQEYETFGVQWSTDGIVCFFDEHLIPIDAMVNLIKAGNFTFSDILYNCI